VSVHQDDVQFLFTPCRHLGKAWPVYQDALVGAKFVDLEEKHLGQGRTGKFNVLKGDEKVASAVAKLQAAGLVVRVDEATRAAITRGAEVLRKRADVGAAQLEAARTAVTEGGEEMKAHQDPGVAWLASRRSALLLDEMGLGKTMQTVLSGLPGEAQVIACPASVVGAWVAEYARWRPDLSVATLDSAAEFAWPAPGAVLVTTHDRIPPARAVVVEHLMDFRQKVLRWLAAAWAGWGMTRLPVLRKALPTKSKPQGPTRVVIDEVHEFRTPASDRARNMRLVVRDALKQGRALGLTGTLIQNRPSELKAVLDLLDLFQESFGSWTRYTRAFGGVEAVRKSNAEATPEVLEAIGRVALRRTAEGVGLALPPLTFEERRVVLDGRAEEAAAELKEYVLRRVVGADNIKAALEAASDVGSVSSARRIVALAKLLAAVAFAEECEAQGEPLVVGTGCTDVALALGSRAGWASITGTTPPKERTRIVERFQRGDLKGVAVAIRAGGTGITLTRAATLLLVDLDWNPARNAQMAKRIHRIGQTRPCRVVTLVADCWIDHAVNAVCAAKMTLASQSLDGLEGRDAPRTLVPDVRALRGQPVAGGLVITPDLARRLLEGQKARRPLASWLHARWPCVGDSAPGAVRSGGEMRPTLDLLAAEGS
jgi:hypothetical protein